MPVYYLSTEYRVESDNDDLRLWEFETPQDVATFMWGRDFRHYRIYKRGHRFEWTSGDLAKFKIALERFES